MFTRMQFTSDVGTEKSVVTFVPFDATLIRHYLSRTFIPLYLQTAADKCQHVTMQIKGGLVGILCSNYTSSIGVKAVFFGIFF